MVERYEVADMVTDEREQAKERAERLRWINARMRGASEADLIEEASIVDDDDERPLDIQ